jgi:hypothetical protein
MRLTQHPALVPRFELPEVAEALARCPKLQTVLDCLRAIKVKHEKALIFTRTLDMQLLLATVIGAEFGLYIDIINGATSRRGDTRSGIQPKNSRPLTASTALARRAMSMSTTPLLPTLRGNLPRSMRSSMP